VVGVWWTVNGASRRDLTACRGVCFIVGSGFRLVSAAGRGWPTPEGGLPGGLVLVLVQHCSSLKTPEPQRNLHRAMLRDQLLRQ
jgi:hypothetical protein